jgi:DNA-binding transcriptional MerR regulator
MKPSATAMNTTPTHTISMTTESLGATQHRISEAAALSGVSAANIRFYEKEGLIAAKGRSGNGYRFYSAADVHQLRFIRLCRALDMSLDEVRTLLELDLNVKADCATARLALDGHVEHVRARLKELTALEKNLKALRNRCDGQDTHCHLIEALHEQADALPLPAGRVSVSKRHV